MMIYSKDVYTCKCDGERDRERGGYNFLGILKCEKTR